MLYHVFVCVRHKICEVVLNITPKGTMFRRVNNFYLLTDFLITSLLNRLEFQSFAE